MTTNQVLVVEDEPKIAELLVSYLERDGFSVSLLADGDEVIEFVRSNDLVGVLLDMMLPGKDGLTLCKEIRLFSSVPIMLVTARVEEIDRLIGLECGADDYICKPFSPREVVARLRAILRRVNLQPAETGHDDDGEMILNYRNITLIPDRHACQVSDEPVELTAVEFRLLQTFIARPGRVFSRERLMHASYLDNRIVSDRTIDSHIKNLRKKLGEPSPNGQPDAASIESLYGVGYRMQ